MNRTCSIACLFKQAYKLAADDGASSILLSTLQGLTVADAEANHARVTQLHRIDAFKVSLFLLVEFLLSPRCSSRRHHVDESVGVFVDKADAFVARFGGDEHDDAQVVAVGNRFVGLKIVLERQVGNDDTVDANLVATLAERLETKLHDGVEIAHKN